LKSWTKTYLEWIRTNVHFAHKALPVKSLNDPPEVEQIAQRILHLETAINEAARETPAESWTIIEALQSLRGLARTAAAMIFPELGALSRFVSPGQSMGHSGLVASEQSGGKAQSGAINRPGNAHSRLAPVEVSRLHPHRPKARAFCCDGNKILPGAVK
jgi:transposase